MNDDMRKYFDTQFSTLKNDLSVEIGEVSQSVSLLATHMDKRFAHMDKRFADMDKRFDAVDENLTILNRDTQNQDKRIKFIENRLPKLA